MIFLLASNRHASIACNDSRFYSVVQNSRNVTHIPYINYLCISFCWLLGYSNSFVLAFLFFFSSFFQSLRLSMHELLQPFKNFAWLSLLDWVPHPWNTYTCCSGISEWPSLRSNSRSNLSVAGACADDVHTRVRTQRWTSSLRTGIFSYWMKIVPKVATQKCSFFFFHHPKETGHVWSHENEASH